MSTLRIRLPDDLDARLSEESRISGQSRSLLACVAVKRFLARRYRERLLVRLSAAAAAVECDAADFAAEALPLDNESLALAEEGDLSDERPASGEQS